MKYSLILSTIQDTAGIITIFGALLVLGVVVFIISTSHVVEDGHEAHDKVYHLRRYYFWGLIAVLFIALVITLPKMPYGAAKHKTDKVVTIVGFQWGWKMGLGETNETPQDFKGQDNLVLPVNEPIKFLVTSQDVNHSFGVYDADGHIVCQTQAMPFYHNPLEYTFTKSGEYKVLCLEYCGLSHSRMIGKFQVK